MGKSLMFRRSNKSIDTTHSFNPIPAKSDIAIVPPKKVIVALYDHIAPVDPPHYLSFHQGDFLHVVGREDDQDWYEACNPVQGQRGLVPVQYFKVVGKTVRDSNGSALSGGSAQHDSGYVDTRATTTPTTISHTPISSTPISSPSMQQNRRSAAKLPGALMGGAGAGGAAMVYGIVAYDFHAERPDELDAKEGEAVIVIAQSNPEWFVAKPITRLGGPGLIPVSFIEIKDMHTGQTVQDTNGAVQRAGIPRVEEWKKMAADYKNTSIPLGSFETTSTPPMSANNGLDHSMQRMSLGAHQNSYGPHTPYTPAQSAFPASANSYGPSSALAAMRASVPRYTFANDKFYFIVDCSMSNGTRWELSRKYEDFYELQINLINAFPDEAGKNDKPRVLPYMPGPVKFVTAKISEGRRQNLDQYLSDLLALGPHIARSHIVCNFFAPVGGDNEVNGDNNDHGAQNRYSQASRGSLQDPYNTNRYSQERQQTSYLNGSAQQTPGLMGPPSDYPQPGMQRQMTSTSNGANALKVKVWFDINTCVVVRMPPKHQFNYADLYRKIVERRKLEYSGKRDNGLDSPIDADQDLDPELEFKYRDERNGDYHLLSDDKDLEDAMQKTEKLTIAVTAVTSDA